MDDGLCRALAMKSMERGIVAQWEALLEGDAPIADRRGREHVECGT